MKLYKVITEDNQSAQGGSFDWTEYLPKKDGSPGEWTPVVPVKQCFSGYHITPYWNMWYDREGLVVYEVEVKDLSEGGIAGVTDKYTSSSIRLLKRLRLRFKKELNTGDQNTGEQNTGNRNTGSRNTGDQNTGNRNTGDQNTGNRNTGDRNTGYRNTGDWNTGDRNTGHRNTGDQNTGHWNTGDRNTGHQNTGDRNTGHWNTGDRNIGNWNTGHWNTGDRNTGHWNTGHWNTGNRNTGNWNTGNWNTGYFNTTKPAMTLVFEKPLSMDEVEHIYWPSWFYFDILPEGYHHSWKKAMEEACAEDVEEVLSLPNFSFEVWEKITGIAKDELLKKINSK